MTLLAHTSREVQATDLADWLEQQDKNAYWTVDGDPVLGRRLSVPCPSGELVAELRRINKPLLVFDPPGVSHPLSANIVPPRLDDFVDREALGTRVLQFQWKGFDSVWLLIEDEETSKSVSQETSSD